jgi:DNA-binding SARP family transcriptional activator
MTGRAFRPYVRRHAPLATSPRRRLRRETNNPSLIAVDERVQAEYETIRALVLSMRRTFIHGERYLELLRSALTGLSLSPPAQLQGGVSVGGESSGVCHLRVCLFGRFSAFIDGREITAWQGSRPKALFKYLVTHRAHRIPREQLMEALWQDADPNAAANSLRVTVHALRQTLATSIPDAGRDAFITYEDNTYSFSPALTFWVDVDEFEQHCQSARHRERSRDNGGAMRALEAADALYVGDFLADDPYDDWTLLRREGLKDLQLFILGKLGQHYLANDQFEACVARCQKILGLDPCQEEAYRWLMSCYARMGHPGRVRRWYELCDQMLRRELDVGPSQETVDLYRRLAGGNDEH